MKYAKLLLILLTCAYGICPAQPTDITGLWKGTMYNDTTQKYFRYEVGISKEKKGYSGFSHTWFVIGDTQYFGVKKVKISIADDGNILIEDNGLIAHNYPIPPNKGVRQLNVLTLTTDSVLTLQGPFSTNRTKEYHPLTGKIFLQRKNDFWQSSLVPHLQELGRDEDLSFVKEEKKMLAIKANDAHQNAIEQEPAPPSLSNKAPIAQQTKVVKPVKKNSNPSPGIAANTVKPRALPPISVAVTTDTVSATVTKPAIIPAPLPAADIAKRSTIVQQTVSFSADSLQLSLYDNGEVDGDTVSVMMNGELIIAKQRLSTTAVKKTIYIPKNVNQVELVMYAESLGSIPPNTGLLVIREAGKLHELRFSGDLKQNAAILLKRE